MGTGVAASFRPRKYYRVPKETLETFLDDIEQLINFFVIEFQRILFAENPAATVGVRVSFDATGHLESGLTCALLRRSSPRLCPITWSRSYHSGDLAS